MNDDAFALVTAKESGHYKTGVETIAQFYKRTIDTRFVNERERFNTWFNEFPQEEHEEIKQKLASNRDVYHDIHYELLLYQLFKRQGFTISIHPEIQGVLTKPDFLIEKDGFKCYVEATIIKGTIENNDCIRKNKEIIYQAINAVDTNGYMISIMEFTLNTNLTLSGKVIVNKILEKLKEGFERQLSSFDFEIVDQEYSIILGAFYFGHKYEPFENRSNIASYEPQYFIGDRNYLFCKGFEKKRKHYGKLNYPFIICVNLRQLLTSCDWEDVDEMLIRNITLNNSELKEGIFSINDKYLHKGVSGILFSQDIGFPTKNEDYRFLLHPQANLPIDISEFSLAYHKLVDGELVRSEGKVISEIIYPHLY